jgi:hypothetical protein
MQNKNQAINIQMSNIIDTATNLVNSDRQIDYGHPAEDFTRIAGILNALGFSRKLHSKDKPIEATDVPIMMIAVKLSREMNKHKDDNLVDIIGYTKCLDMVHEYDKMITARSS